MTGTVPKGTWLADELDEPERVHPFPGNELVHVQDLGAQDSCNPGHADDEQRTPVEDLDLAVVVSSRMTDEAAAKVGPWSIVGALNPAEMHRPVLDLDIDAKLLPSSTRGHWHLYLDRPMSWSVYQELLVALAKAGIVESGYAAAASRRGATHVRVPWMRKGDRHPQLPRTLVDRIKTCVTRDELGELYVANVDAWGDAENSAARERAEEWAA